MKNPCGTLVMHFLFIRNTPKVIHSGAWAALTALTVLNGCGPAPQTAVSRPLRPEYHIGNLGGMAVRIPSHCVELVEYDGDPRIGETRKTPAPARDFNSRLRSFGITNQFPDMTCLAAGTTPPRRPGKPAPDSIYIGVNAGEIYPRSGAEAADRNARVVIDSVQHPGPYWFANYERVPGQTFGLEAYVVTGQDPQTGQPARDSLNTDEVFIHLQPTTGQADIFISCNKARPPAGQARCQMRTGMEPSAEARLNISFPRGLLAHWQEIHQRTIQLLTSFKTDPHSSLQTSNNNHSTDMPGAHQATFLRAPS
jgi:hypothetical protein